MDEVNTPQHTTSILELLFLIRAKNWGDISFAECMRDALAWARAVIAEYETREANACLVNKNKCG